MNAPADISVDAKPRALVSPWADFWLVGGASLLAFVLFILVTDVAGIDLQNRPFYWAFYISFFINDPHFIYSYLLFYRGFWQRLAAPETEPLSRLRQVFAGLVVPAAMTVFIIFALFHPDKRYVSWAEIAMVFSVGWHYVKQGYGVLITLSLYEGVFYDAAEKRVLWASAYAIWVYSWICGFAFGVDLINPSGAHPHPSALLPQWFDRPALLGAVLAVPAAVTLVRHFFRGGGMSVNAVMGYACATWMWVMMPFIKPVFLAVIPMFHGLQYLPFVYKMKRTEFAQERSAAKGDNSLLRLAVLRAGVFLLLGIALSVLFFSSLPKFLDQEAAAAHVRLSESFFFLMFLSFINIHHYFMDSAFWRRDNAEVQSNLFRA